MFLIKSSDPSSEDSFFSMIKYFTTFWQFTPLDISLKLVNVTFP